MFLNISTNEFWDRWIITNAENNREFVLEKSKYTRQQYEDLLRFLECVPGAFIGGEDFIDDIND